MHTQCLYVFVYFIVHVQHSITVSTKPRMSRSKCKSSSGVAGTAKKHQVITMETKEKIIQRVEQQGVTKELKRFMKQGNDREISFLLGSTVSFLRLGT